MQNKFIWIFIFSVQVLTAAETFVHLDMTNGYRQDRISTLVEAFDPPGTQIASDSLKATNLPFYQIGVDGKLSLCGLFIRIDADWAWANHGDYKEVVSTPEGLSSTTKGHVHDAKARDFGVGVGYLYPFNEDFSLGPVGGWQYHLQKFKVRDPRTDGIPDPILNGLKYTDCWHGPWLGFDLAYRFCKYSFHTGYEYDWAEWHATWRLKGPDVPGVAFSDHRKSNQAHGQVIYLDAKWHFYDCWSLGCGLKYQMWKATHGKVNPLRDNAPVSSTEVDKVNRAKWTSFTATLDLGVVW